MKNCILIITLLLLAAASSAQNDESADTLTAGGLSEVVISANRFSTIGLNTPAAIRILTSRPVQEHQLRTSAEALSLTPGVFVQKTNHGGGSPFVRGLTGNQTLLLMDGIRLSNSTMRYGPNQYFNTIDIFSLDRIEVLRGSGSVQYGSDALGGTIQAFSNEINTAEEADWGGNLLTRISIPDMERSLHSDLSFSGRFAAMRAGITWRNFADIVGGDTTGRQVPSGYDEFDHDFKGKVILSPKSSFTILYQNVSQRNVPVYHKIMLENYAINKTDPQKRKLGYMKFNRDFNTRVLKSAVLTASFQETREGRVSQKNGSDILRNEYDKVRTLGFSAEAIVSDDDRWSGTMGFEVYSDLVKSSRTDTDLITDEVTVRRGLYPDGSSMKNMALFTVHSLDLVKWNITAGVRFNSFIINVGDQGTGSAKLTPSALVGNLAVLRKINEGSSLFVSVNTGFRAPNIDDLGTLGIVDFRYEIPNSRLKPESSIQYEAGYKYIGQKFRGDLFIYRNDLYNLITRMRIGDETLEGYPLYQKENSERAYIQGVEAACDFIPVRDLTLSGNITYTYGQNITKNEPVRRIPPLFGRAAFDCSPGKWHFGLEWLAASKQDRLAQGDLDDNRIPEGGTPGWNIFNMNTGYTWKTISANLSFNNLFNRDYRYHGSGVNGYGRSLFVTMKVNL